MFAYDFQAMANTRANARRYGDGIENQEVSPQGNQVSSQVLNALQVGTISLEEFRTSMNFFAQSLTARENREVVDNPFG